MLSSVGQRRNDHPRKSLEGRFPLVTFFLLCVLCAIRRTASIEPGKPKEESEFVEEVIVSKESTTTETGDMDWVPEAVLDVAYYLRKYKNNGYDPRYLTESNPPVRDLYKNFPDPPLRNLHWEVKKNCEPSFVECVRYLQQKIDQTELPRHMDSLTVMKHNKWTMDKDEDLIRESDNACVELRDRDEKTFNVFRSPLQRFQWLTTASYYMCWYTMKQNHHLARFEDDCDNFANCIDWTTGPHNRDIRADNAIDFACAAYSFCPDVCCPERLVRNLSSCGDVNPCSRHKPLNDSCLFTRELNADFDSITQNRWNISCDCGASGLQWDSKSGQCVDIDECDEDPCEQPSQTCFNLPGGFACICSQMGYTRSSSGACELDPIVHKAIYPSKVLPEHLNKTFADNFFDFVYGVKSVFS